MRVRLVLLSVATCFCLAPFVAAQDAVKVDPKHYSVVSENNEVRILKAHYGAHEKSVMHTHPDAVAIFQTDGRVKFTFPNGKTEERDMKAGTSLYTPATRHLPENLSDGDMEVILVEMKVRKRKPAPKTPATPTPPTN